MIRPMTALATLVVRRFREDRLGSAVAALTYVTLLALIPMLVIAFSVLSSFSAFAAAQERLEVLLYNTIVPEAGAMVRDHIATFTRNAQDLTAIGIAGLSVSALFLLGTIESTLNAVWRVVEPRSLLKRLLIYWATLTLGPILIGLSLTLTTDVIHAVSTILSVEAGFRIPRDITVLGQTARTIVSIAITTTGCTLLYFLVPAREVRFSDALLGGVFAALCFEVLNASFNAVVLSTSAYSTIYGVIVALPIFLLWVYSSWMVVTVGAVFAASMPDWRIAEQDAPDEEVFASRRLELALIMLGRLALHSKSGGPLGEDDLRSGLPSRQTEEVMSVLLINGYIAFVEGGGILLARSPDTIFLADIATDIDAGYGLPNRASDLAPTTEGDRHLFDQVDQLLARLRAADSKFLDVPLSDLVVELDTRIPLQIASRD